MRMIALALTVIAPALFATGASAQTERRYDAQGRSIGRAETRGDTTRGSGVLLFSIVGGAFEVVAALIGRPPSGMRLDASCCS